MRLHVAFRCRHDRYKIAKIGPDDRRFCCNSLSETQNSASATMHRCQEGHDMHSMRNCAFRSVIRGKIGVATTHPERGQKSKRAVFQQPQYDFWMRSKWSKMACRSIGNRKSGCGCSAGAISADPASKMHPKEVDPGALWAVSQK